MLKYVDTQVVFREIPDEITLAINISNCPNACPGCHSPHLAGDIGEFLWYHTLDKLIRENKGITCVAFMGGDSETDSIILLANWVRRNYPFLKIAWYSGKSELPKIFNDKFFNYIKLGPYIEELGPLDNPNTNQRLYAHLPECRVATVIGDKTLFNWADITYKFWKNNDTESIVQ